VKSHVSSLKAAQKCRYLVADAALYVKETILGTTLSGAACRAVLRLDTSGYLIIRGVTHMLHLFQDLYLVLIRE
jgi:hypothetical protein